MKGLQDVESAPILEKTTQDDLLQPWYTVRSDWKKLRVVCVALVALFTLNASTPSGARAARHWALQAFRQHQSLTPEQVEELYLSVPDPASALAASREYATHPHIAGGIEDFADAQVILKLFQKEFGIRDTPGDIHKLRKPIAWIDKYFPVMNTPLDRALSILGEGGKPVWEADLVEDGDPRDPEAGKYRDAVPTFHGLSADGDVKGEIVYVNYGRKEDYDEIVAKGGSLEGKIALARYGGIKGAQERGAVGVLIYSDPRDDGVVTEENGYATYPEGPARNPTSVQRGSVQFISMYPGDPTTPGIPAYENATRTEGENIPKIPSLPISWANAEVLLKEISGTQAKDAFNMMGTPSEKKVRLVNHVHTRVIPIWNTMAVIPGHIKNETVLVGCHRDAWVMGAADPTSGTVSIHEVVKGFGELLRSGWKPLRNVVIASWDAEEYGLIGSTEWAEDFPEWIQQNVVAYINLVHLIKGVALDVPHPNDTDKTLWDARQDSGPFHSGMDGMDIKTMDASLEGHWDYVESELNIPPLGSGSDYTPFLQRLGVASMDQGFSGTLNDAPYHYHSVYDSQMWMERYGDPGFVRHVAVAKHLGLVVLRLTDSIILPLNTTHYTTELDAYLDKVESIASSLGAAADFTDLRKSIADLQAASAALDVEKVAAERHFRELLDKLPGRPAHAQGLPGWVKRVLRKILRHGVPAPVREFIKAAKRVQAANAKLVAFERGFISEEGIKEREWYKHLGVAPGKWLGYGATTLPSVTEALTFEGNATLAELEAARVSALLDELAKTIKP
ncbi:Zn-dependent exopeptidase [Epithele typhae]|uniref:Zn-dependent exopeptidase n=1 Tax=Epithele typhae TaxID=378194 RepID=UPI002007FA64|nr:Zn-dependent exopeptidase [Epithele typhae]KAH9943274.1 Zn-dependent exopeptidase [Epithele typhae]